MKELIEFYITLCLRYVSYITVLCMHLCRSFEAHSLNKMLRGQMKREYALVTIFRVCIPVPFFLIIVLLWGGNFLLAGFKNSCVLRSSKEMRSIFNVESCALQLQINFRHYIIEVNQYSLHVHQRRRRNLSKTAISS